MSINHSRVEEVSSSCAHRRKGRTGATACEEGLPRLHPHSTASQQGGWEFSRADDKDDDRINKVKHNGAIEDPSPLKKRSSDPCRNMAEP